MSRLSPFSPSHTKAICFPSGEKAGSDLRPEKLVKGTIFETVTGDFVARPINLYSAKTTAASASPSATETITTPFLCRLSSLTRYSALDVERDVPMDTVPLAVE